MNPRSFIQILTILVIAQMGTRLLAQDAAEPAVENAKYQIAGVVNGNAVFVRSGPSDNDYATIQLNKGAEVTVVGERFNWLKIIPPEGSFCYVAKAYVNRSGNGSIGVVTDALNVRVGSQLNLLKTKIASRLEPNQRVEITGEQDEYFKIKPPADVYFYVNKQFVDPVRQLPQPGSSAIPIAAKTSETQTQEKPEAQPKTDAFADAGPTTQTAGPTTTEAGVAAAPSTQPTVADAQTEFERLETLYSQSSQRPLDEQPITELLSGYQKLATSDTLPESMRRIAEFKASALQSRAKMQEELIGYHKIQEDMKSKQMALGAEQKELQDRITKTQIQFYTAIGTLRTSSLQIGQAPTLYRLTDPANGRTIVYLRSDDPKLSQHLGEFIGVRGDVSTDAQRTMTTIALTSFEPVDPAKFGQSSVAQFAPPSLLPGVVSGSGE